MVGDKGKEGIKKRNKCGEELIYESCLSQLNVNRIFNKISKICKDNEK
jgi:hypothetical protein